MSDKDITEVINAKFVNFINHENPDFDVIEVKHSDVVIIIELDRIKIFPSFYEYHQDENSKFIDFKYPIKEEPMDIVIRNLNKFCSEKDVFPKVKIAELEEYLMKLLKHYVDDDELRGAIETLMENLPLNYYYKRLANIDDFDYKDPGSLSGLPSLISLFIKSYLFKRWKEENPTDFISLDYIDSQR